MTQHNEPHNTENPSEESGGLRGMMGSFRKKVTDAIESDESGRLRGAVDSTKAAVDMAGEKVKRPMDVISLAEFRTEFEQFTQAVSTAVIGVHQDQASLGERLDRLEERLARLEQSTSRDES